jgi:hypothetical protein
MRKYGLKVLGLTLLAAISMMALSAAAAQAGSEVFVEGKVLTGEKPIKGTVGAGELLTAGGIQISCTGGTVTGTIKNKEAMGSGNANATFSGCNVKSAESVCKVYDALNMFNAGVILASAEALLSIHKDGKHYLLLKGLGEKEIFAEFAIEDPLLLDRCPIAGDYVISGLTVVALTNPLVEGKTQAGTTIAPATLESLFPTMQLFLGKEKSHLSGGVSASIELNSGEKFGVK